MPRVTEKFLICVCVLLSMFIVAAEEQASYTLPKANRGKRLNAGTVFFSNGKKLVGELSLTKGRKLKINSSKGTRKFSLRQIRKLEFHPEKREMEQKWMFPEAGKTRKEKYGKPYPVQHLKTTLILRNGEKISGHLFSTVLYLRPAVGKRKRVILKSKQRGKEGETFKDLVYPERIVVSADSHSNDATPQRWLPPAGFNLKECETAALSLPELLTVKLKKSDSAVSLEGTSHGEIVAAIKHKDKILVFWPGGDNKEIFIKVKKAIAEMSDFFDERELKAVYWPGKGDTIFSLTMMIRRGATSLHKKESNPWRLIVQRWKYDRGSDALLLSGKGWLFRGIGERGGKTPECVLYSK